MFGKAIYNKERRELQHINGKRKKRKRKCQLGTRVGEKKHKHSRRMKKLKKIQLRIKVRHALQNTKFLGLNLGKQEKFSSGLCAIWLFLDAQ